MNRGSRGLVARSEVPEHEAIRLLSAASGLSYSDIALDADVADSGVAVYEAFVARRLAGEPLQYIEGVVPFGPVEIAVDPRVLIPRPETEELLEMAVGLVADPRIIVDLCTGSGNLAVALSATFPRASVHATDTSPDAVDVADANALRNRVRVSNTVGDLFEPLPPVLRGSVDLIVANPPYLSEEEYTSVPPDVTREPRAALVGGPTGLETLERIASEAPTWLAPGGAIICEISEHHGSSLISSFAHLAGEVRSDLSGKDRFVVGHRVVE